MVIFEIAEINKTVTQDKYGGEVMEDCSGL